jgi:hypothetical protein
MKKLFIWLIFLSVFPVSLKAQQSLSSASPPCAAIPVTGVATLGIQVTGTWSGTLQPEVSIGGNAFVNTQVTPSTSSTAQSTITASGAYIASVAGYDQFQICFTSYASGTAVISYRPTSLVNASLFGSSGGGGGTVTSVAGTTNQIDSTGGATPVLSLDPVITLPGTINKYTLTPPATGATLTIANGKTFTASNTLTLSGTDGSTLNVGAGGTLGSGAYAAAGVPGGSNGQVQYNNSGAFGGLSGISHTAGGAISTINMTVLTVPVPPTGTPNASGGTIPASVNNYGVAVALDSGGNMTGGQFSSAVTTTGTTSSITWTWTAISGASSYQLWVCNGASCTSSFANLTSYFPASGTTVVQTAASGTAGSFPATNINNTGALFVGNIHASGLDNTGLVQSFGNNTRDGAVTPELDDYESLLLTSPGGGAPAVLDDVFNVQDNAGSFIQTNSGAPQFFEIGDPQGDILKLYNGLFTFNAPISGTTTLVLNDNATAFYTGNGSGTGAIHNGVTATTQAASDNSTKLETTAGTIAKLAAPPAIGGTTPNSATFTAQTVGNVGGTTGATTYLGATSGSIAWGCTTATCGTIGASATVSAGGYRTTTNCSSSASPAVCGSAAAGTVALPTNAVSSSIVVNTTAVTANSEIFVQTDDTLGTKLGVTCNSTVATLVGGLTISARSAGASFTIANNVAIVTNPLCVSYTIVN